MAVKKSPKNSKFKIDSLKEEVKKLEAEKVSLLKDKERLETILSIKHLQYNNIASYPDIAAVFAHIILKTYTIVEVREEFNEDYRLLMGADAEPSVREKLTNALCKAVGMLMNAKTNQGDKEAFPPIFGPLDLSDSRGEESTI